MTNNRHPACAGNAFLYILIAVALFAALSFILMRNQSGGDQDQFSEAKVQLAAQKLIQYANSISSSYLNMKDTNTDLDELSLVLPDAGTFNTPPVYHKLFHPGGGGLVYQAMDGPDVIAGISAADPGWHFVKVQADWSPTAETDFVATLIDLPKSVCAELNLRLTGDAAIPVTTVNYTNTFINGTTDLTEVTCADCPEKQSFCMDNGDGYAFYNMIDMR